MMSRQCLILVIEDDPNLLRTLALILDHAGYVVTAAADVPAGQRHLEQSNFDLVILDITGSNADIGPLLACLKYSQPQPPVIFLTGQAQSEVAAKLGSIETRGFLPKPVDPEHILAKVQALLTERQITCPRARYRPIAPTGHGQPGT